MGNVELTEAFNRVCPISVTPQPLECGRQREFGKVRQGGQPLVSAQLFVPEALRELSRWWTRKRSLNHFCKKSAM